MREASFELMGLSPYKNGTPISLQNEREDGTSHHTEEPLGMMVRMKVSTLERSEGVGMLMVERQRPPYDRQNDPTIIELGRESMRWEICGARGRRATGAAFNSTTTTMDQREGPLDMLKGQQLLGQPLNCILQPHPKIMAEHQVIVGSHKEISLERRRRIEEYASSY